MVKEKVKNRLVWCILIIALGISNSGFGATLFEWTGAAGNDWFVAANWDRGSVPGEGDNVVIGGEADILLTNSTAFLSSIVMSGGTLVFSNWTTRLNAETVVIAEALVTCSGPFADSGMSNRVWISCTDFELAESAAINVDACGFSRGNGPGKGGAGFISGGAGYGGHGGYGNQVNGNVYGSVVAPLIPGSGGGSFSSSQQGSDGGGAVLLEASGDVVIKGLISACGGKAGTRTGAGSGGAVFITCQTIGGCGKVLADGGNASGNEIGGGGGGGRIAIQYQEITENAAIVCSANGATASRFNVDANMPLHPRAPMIGTLWFSDTQLLDSYLASCSGNTEGVNGTVCFGSIAIWECSLTILNSRLGVGSNQTWQVTDDLTVTGGALYVGELAELRVDGDLTLKHGASMKVFGGSASEHNRNNYGAKVDVSGRLQVETGAWIYPYSHSTNGSHILFKAATLVIEEGGGIDADGRGYCRGYGPGVPTDGYNTGGGGYGGRGGDGDRYVGGLSYGSLAEPFEAGSGSGNYLNNGGHGGGSVHLDIAESAVINGTVSACGVSSGGSHSGGGSGGAINIECHSFGGGSQGFIRVDGGGGSNAGAAKTGSGGGGRIAVHYNTILPLAAVRFSANHGLTGPYLYNYSVPSDVVAPTLGTVWFPDGSLWSRALESWGGIADSINGNLYFGDGGTVCTITNLSLLRNSNLMVGAGQEWSLTTDITIQTSRLTVAESAKLYCKGDMVLGDYSELIAWSGPTNGISGEIYGSLVEVDGEMLISSNAWVYPFANSTNGAAPFFEVGKLMVKHGGGINADGCGFARGAGPGCGVSGYNAGGAGYGGDGGAGQRFGRGYAYGSALRPALPGSGGGIYSSGRGHGGGLIWIKARQEILLDGLLTACGGSTRTTRGGGGSGGGIYLVAPKIAGGQTAIFRCDGGQGTAGASGGGGGGRIAVWFGVEYSPDISDKRVIISELPLENYQGVANVAGGGGFEEGEEGTMRFVRVLPAPGTVLMLR